MTNESSDRGVPSVAPQSFKPLIRFGNVTYRIGRLSYGQYEVVRILDDVRLGTFESYPCLTVTSATIEPSFILRIAQAAARGARPSWIDRLAHAIRRKSGIRPKVTEESELEGNSEEAETEPEPDSLQNPRERG
jgi:hypothetical protein